MGKVNIEQTLSLLTRQHGDGDCPPGGPPLDVLVQTILSQNTSDINSGRAFKSLRDAFPGWKAVASAQVSDIAASIKVGGLEQIKARRIKQALGEIQQKRGRLELDFLAELTLGEARDWLRQLPGVGTKTANCVLLFSLGKAALPVDTHIFRVAKRLGLIDHKASVEQAHQQLEARVPAEKVYQFHVLMIEHGRKVCKAQRPHCNECLLRRYCPSYKVFAPELGL